MHPTLSDSKPDFELAIEYLHKELRQIRKAKDPNYQGEVEDLFDGAGRHSF